MLRSFCLILHWSLIKKASETYTLYNLPKGQIWFNDVNNKCSGCSRPPLILPVFSASIPPSCFNLELQVSTPIVCSSSAWMVKFEAVLPFWPAEITWELTFCPQHFQASQNDERCVQIQRMENVWASLITVLDLAARIERMLHVHNVGCLTKQRKTQRGEISSAPGLTSHAETLLNCNH